MSRDALVVGINSYSYDLLKNLAAPAQDAEAVAQLLENSGEFKVKRLPAVKDNQNNKICLGKTTKVSLTQLEEAIVQLFKPESRNIPDTALLYFSGHGLRKDRGIQEGYLATSDVNPNLGNWGIRLKWLRELLQESPVQQQIIWLDCCYSGELLNVAEADPGDRGKGRDRCFIAASREFEVAYEAIDSKHSVLTEALLQGLDPRRHDGTWVTNYTLIDVLNQHLQPFPQSPIFANSGGAINLTRIWQAPKDRNLVVTMICPYRGLQYFDYTEEDAKYFYGRKALTDQLLEKVRVGNFLAVLGNSGSGKSSVVRAGLLYQLTLGRLSGSDTWQIRIFQPGEHPLESLARAFLDSGLSDIERASQLAQSEELIDKGSVGLGQLIKAVDTKRVLLMVDQFEEVFTLCKDISKREQFFKCLLDALQQCGDKLCLVLTMRLDFFSKCAEYGGLTQQIQENLVTVIPMTEEELRQAITEPAKLVDLKVEPELVNQMIVDVEGSPGSLPLLQYTLTELWKQQSEDKLDKLTVSAYTRLGGVKGTLQKRATKIYQGLSPEEQQVAKRIFLELTQLGEGTEDTRRRVLLQNLVTAQQSKTLGEQVIQKLASANLVVTSEISDRGTGTGVAVVDIAHEALIRYWSVLRQWLNENRDNLRKQRRIEKDAEDWHNSGSSQDYLLQGLKLAEAKRDLNNSISLNELAERFVLESIKHEEKSIKQREKSIKQRKIIRQTFFVVISLLAIIALWQANLAIQSQVLALTSSSENSFIANDQIGALMASLKASRKLDQAIGLKDNDRDKTVKALQQAVDGLQERNRLEGHDNWVYGISFSPDKKTIATASADKTVRLWNLDGTKIETPIVNGSDWFYGVSFSPDGKTFTAASKNGSIKLWTVGSKEPRVIRNRGPKVYSISFSPNGKLIAIASADRTVTLQTLDRSKASVVLRGHTDEVFDVSFSPKGDIIATASADRTAKLWNLDGTLRHTLKKHEDKVYSISFSPNGNTLATASWDKTAMIWNLDGEWIKTLKGHTDRVVDVSFSPDKKFIATASWDRTVKVWTAGGGFLQTLKGHGDRVLSISFSLDNKTIASASADKTVKLWRRDDTLLPILQEHTDLVRSVSFSPDGKTLATASDDKTVKVWDLNGGSGTRNLEHSGRVYGVSFSHDGTLIATASADKKARLWTLDDDKKPKTVMNHDDEVFDVSVSPDGKKIATASADKTARLWDRDGKPRRTFEGHEDRVVDVSFSPDSETLATASDDKTARLWILDSKKSIVLNGHTDEVNAISFSPINNNLIATASDDQSIRLWNKNGQEIKTKTQAKHDERVLGVTFSPDGNTLASASFDKTVKLWDLNNLGDGKFDITLLQTFKGHDDWVWNVSFDQDGKTLASASSDHTVRLWKVDSQKTQSSNLGELQKRGCEKLSDYLKTNINVSPEDRRLCD